MVTACLCSTLRARPECIKGKMLALGNVITLLGAKHRPWHRLGAQKVCGSELNSRHLEE